MDSSDKDKLPMEPNSKDKKDNDQEAEDILSISILPRLIQLAAPRTTSVNGLGTSIMRDCLWRVDGPGGRVSLVGGGEGGQL